MTTYITKELRDRYPHIATLISGMIDCKGGDCREMNGTRNIWARDYMPIRTNSHYTKFKCSFELPAKDGKSYPQLTVPTDVWHKFCDAESPIVLDGGNVEQHGCVALITEMVFRHNKGVDPHKLSASLETVMDREVVYMPVEPYDTLGHIDGIARFIDDKRVLVNDYSRMLDQSYDFYQERVAHRLRLNGLEVVPLINAHHMMPKMSEKQFRKRFPMGDDFNPAFGYYINFYRTSGLLFMPIFNIREDNEAYRTLHSCFPGDEIVPVNCSELSMEGGLCNCVTWEWEDAKHKRLA